MCVKAAAFVVVGGAALEAWDTWGKQKRLNSWRLATGPVAQWQRHTT